ncbi:flagellar protein FliS [Alkalicoccus luteus]|uniref:Flagellar protein FliS n=1 Tax=Alkalicoccus luteus TaxID=1237094 RepID=A0A969PTF8_9BACI|nr:flagellar protein FliS [Alkalicoccus luteus]NJP38804.1 flagellar protein FliS [Alkalicoccus luteus]
MFTEKELYVKTSQQLTALLLEALCLQMEKAENEIEQKQYMSANKALQQAADICERLGAGLRYEAGIIADQLEAIYQYTADELIQCNLTKDADRLRRLRKMVEPLYTDWLNVVRSQAGKKPQSGYIRQLSAYEQHIGIENQEESN